MESKQKVESGQGTEDTSSKRTPPTNSVEQLKRLLEKVNSLPKQKREVLSERVMAILNQKRQNGTKTSEPDQGTLFDVDGIAQEDDDTLFLASESPERQAGRILRSVFDNGVTTFEDYIAHARTQLRDDQIRQNASNLEGMWDKLRSRGAKLGPVGNAVELLEAAKPVKPPKYPSQSSQDKPLKSEKTKASAEEKLKQAHQAMRDAFKGTQDTPTSGLKMSEKHSKNSGLKELFLESLASKPQLPKKSADQSLPIILAFLEELQNESQSEQEAEEPKKPLQDQA